MSDSGTLRSISWSELFPWLIIFRSFAVSLGLTAMAAAILGSLLMPLGWRVASLFLDRERLNERPVLQAVVHELGTLNPRLDDGSSLPGKVGLLPGSDLHHQTGDWSRTFQRLVLPVRMAYRLELSVAEFAYFLLGGLWSLAVWAFFGGIIVRQAIVKLAVSERLAMVGTVKHTASKYVAYLTAPLFPLLAVVLVTLPIALLGLVMRMGDVGALIGALCWVLVLIGGLIMTVTLLGLLFGWPLMWGAIAAERHSDTFDAVSRAYSYVFQRPLHYLFYAVVASLFGALCWLLVDYLEEAVVGLSWWSASWGAGSQRVEELRAAIEVRETLEGFHYFVASLYAFWEGLVRLVATAFRYSFFWTAAAAIYLLLRYDADRTEIDEVYLEENDDLRTLPSLRTDARGVPIPPDAESASEPAAGAEPTGRGEPGGEAFGADAPEPPDDDRRDESAP